MRSAIMARRRADAARRQSVPMRPLAIPPPVQGHLGKGEAPTAAPTYATATTNLFSDGIEVSIRPGYASASGFPAAAIQAWDYEFGGDRKAIFRTSTGLADDDGGVTSAQSFTGDIMVDEISNRLITAGGGVAPILYDGSTFSNAALTMPDGATATLSDFTGVVAHHDRIFLWNESDPDGAQIYYLQGVGAITGQLVAFPLYSLGNIKGQVKTCVSLSIDAGHGSNDVLAIMTTTGQIVVYEGLDPGDATDWRLWGRVPGTSATVSPNAIVRVATDAYALTRLGVMSIRQLLAQGIEGVVSPPSEALGSDLTDDIATGAGFRGWQMIADPQGRFTLLNFPTAADAYAQWVYSYDAKAWFRWTLQARWWFQRADELYFIDTSGAVQLFGGVGDAGAAITATWWTPWIKLSDAELWISSAQVDLLTKSAASLSFACLSDRRETATAVSQATQTVALARQDADSGFQNLDEIFMVGQRGRHIQLRMTLSATEAIWNGVTLNPQR